MSVDDIGSTVTWREAILLTSILVRDPESWTQTVWSGWDFPVSREWIVASQTFDLLAAANSKRGSKPKPYPTPFPNRDAKRVGKTDRSPEEVKRLLRWMNPQGD